ncbi:MAG: ABC transporter ATP-binding protein/permease [Clostridia bacterium]|nr:ABC transporter ATP-binding protein/permease [Clostridia bacterium]
MFFRLLKSVREYKRPAVITLLLMVVEAMIETALPYITATYLINRIQTQGESLDLVHDILPVGLLMVGLALVSLCCGGIGGFTCARAASGFAKNLRNDLFAKIQSFTFLNIDKFSASSLVTRMTTDVYNVQMSFMMAIRTAVRSPLMLIFSVAMAAYMGGWLALTFAVVIPVLGIGLFLVSRKAMPAFHRVFKKYDRLNESIEENVRGMRVVKGFSREEYEKKKFGQASGAIRDDFTKAERIVAINTPLMNFCMYFNMIFILLAGSFLAVRGLELRNMEAAGQTLTAFQSTVAGLNINIGHISALLTYGMSILMSLMMLSMIYVTITISAESMRRIVEVLDEVPDMTNPPEPVYDIPDGSIDFENVSFKYASEAEKFSLADVDLHIPSGATVGILGGTGSSKTTLVQLIPRLYDTTEGCVKVGGRDVREYDITALRESVAMVLQKNLLFAGTIKENLRWGNPDATDEEIVEACRLAQADEFVQSFPDKYDTYIEQGGTNVSGGQKQRLCIARALLKKPKILILDDSTSAVDTRTDALIRAGFASYIPSTTKIIIAQRVASVENADMILVMDNGRILNAGTHEQLLETSPIYREVWEQQTNGGEQHE